MSSIDQQFIEYIVKSLVGNPDAVKVDRRIDEKGVLLELTVDPDDLGRVIGKRGATAQSLRTLLRALGTKNDARYNLKIVDNSPEDRPRRERPEPSQETEQPAESTETKVEQPTEPEPEKTPSSADDGSETSDVVSKTRKELEELDDLDV